MPEEGFSHDENFYYLDGNSSPWISRKSGTGRVLQHLLENQGREVSLEKVAEVSRWKNPRRTMRNHLAILIDAWTPYEVKLTYGKGKRILGYTLRAKNLEEKTDGPYNA